MAGASRATRFFGDARYGPVRKCTLRIGNLGIADNIRAKLNSDAKDVLFIFFSDKADRRRPNFSFASLLLAIFVCGDENGDPSTDDP